MNGERGRGRGKRKRRWEGRGEGTKNEGVRGKWEEEEEERIKGEGGRGEVVVKGQEGRRKWKSEGGKRKGEGGKRKGECRGEGRRQGKRIFFLHNRKLKKWRKRRSLINFV